MEELGGKSKAKNVDGNSMGRPIESTNLDLWVLSEPLSKECTCTGMSAPLTYVAYRQFSLHGCKVCTLKELLILLQSHISLNQLCLVTVNNESCSHEIFIGRGFA